MRLADGVALITGAGSGMGRGGALRFAAEGASIVVADLDEGAAEETVQLVTRAGGKAVAVRTDVSKAEDNARAVAAATEAFGKLSIVWANAGIAHASTPIENLDEATFERTFAVNARGPWLTARAAIPALRANGGGAIVITGSLSGLKARAGNSIYAASKGAAVMLTRVLAVELAPEIRVNCVDPVATDTPMLPSFVPSAVDPAVVREALIQSIPLKRLATIDDIANAALFLASSEAAMITGVNLVVDGGLERVSTKPMPREFYGRFTHGEEQPSASKESFVTRNPADGSVIAAVARCDAADVDAAVASARKAFPAWRDLTGAERGRILLAIAKALREEAQELAVIETLDNGKPLASSRGDVEVAARYFEFYAGLADKIHGEAIPLGPNYHSYTRLEPYGVTAHIVPWNAALQQAARGVAPALATGNVAIVKPAEDTPLSCLELARIATGCGLPPGVLEVVPGFGTEAGAPLVRHSDVRRITFTGSVPTGQEVMRAAAEHLSPVTLELGGKSPNIVFDDADLDAAALGSFIAITANAGQVCAAGSRLLVHRSIHDEMVERLVAFFDSVTLGPGIENPSMGPITTAAQYKKVREYLELGPREGAKVAVGGGVSEDERLRQGQFVQPTIFTAVQNRMRVAQEEIFGPVLCVIPFDSDDEALQIANDTRYGLTAGLWTRDLGRAHRVAANLEAGQISINEWFAGGIDVPFGGYKQSGFGREKGTEGAYHYLQTKGITAKLT